MNIQLQEALQALSAVTGANQAKYAPIIAGINNKTKALRPAHLYFAKKIATNTDLSGIIDVIKVTDTKQEGIRNFDKGRLAEGEVFIATGFSILYANRTTSGGDADTVLFSNKLYNPLSQEFFEAATTDATEYALPLGEQRIPTKMLNAEVKLKRGNNVYASFLYQKFVKENSLDVANGVNVANTTVTSIMASPIVFDAETKIGAEIQFPINGSAGTLDHFIRIEWEGFMVADV